MEEEKKSPFETIKNEIKKEIGEEVGNEIKKEFEKEVEKEVEVESPKKKEKVDPNWMKGSGGMGSRFGYIIAIAFNLLFYWFVNKIPDWNWYFITEGFANVLPYINFSIYASIIAYAIFLVLKVRFVYFVGKTILDGISFFVLIKLLTNFPLAFGNVWDFLFKLIFVIGLAGTVISVFVRVAKFGTGKKMD